MEDVGQAYRNVRLDFIKMKIPRYFEFSQNYFSFIQIRRCKFFLDKIVETINESDPRINGLLNEPCSDGGTFTIFRLNS